MVRFKLRSVQIHLSPHNQELVEVGFELSQTHLTPEPRLLITTPLCLTELALGFVHSSTRCESLGKLLTVLELQSLHQ